MRLAGLHALAAVAAIAACGRASGSAHVRALAGRDTLAGSVARVTITVGAQPPFELTRSGSSWEAVVGALPVGTGQIFHGDAYDGVGVKLFAGVSAPVDIEPGATAQVEILLQQLSAGQPYTLDYPRIDSMVLSASEVYAGGALQLTAAAHTSGPGPLDYAWSAALGSFAPLHGASTAWTAPAAAGPAALTLTVTNAQGAAVSLSASVAVLEWPALTGTSPRSPSLSALPSLLGTAASGSTVRVFDDAACSGAPLASGSATGGTFSIAAAAQPFQLDFFYVRATSPLGTVSPCTGGLAYGAIQPLTRFESSLAPSPVAVAGPQAFFAGVDGASGVEPWTSDGTAEGTALLADLNPGDGDSAPPGGFQFAAAGKLLVFAASDGRSGVQPWVTDGTSAGTAPLVDLGGAAPSNFTQAAGTLFFVAGPQLWATDGSSAGTALLHEFSASPQTLTAAGGKLFFVGWDDAVNGGDTGLWTSDGTPEGTVFVAAIASDGTDQHAMAAFGDLAFFSVYSGGVSGLWKSDGTAQGTVLVKEIAVDSGSYLADLTPALGALFFTAPAADSGRELWRSDGTEAGTALVLDINPGTAPSDPQHLTVSGGALFFSACQPDTGCELWRSDGTAGGTALVQDSAAGAASLNPENLFDAGGVLVYGAAGPGGGHELWLSAGASASTRLLAWMAPGDAPSAPSSFAVLGENLLFFAGAQLWSVPLAALVP